MSSESDGNPRGGFPSYVTSIEVRILAPVIVVGGRAGVQGLGLGGLLGGQAAAVLDDGVEHVGGGASGIVHHEHAGHDQGHGHAADEDDGGDGAEQAREMGHGDSSRCFVAGVIATARRCLSGCSAQDSEGMVEQ